GRAHGRRGERRVPARRCGGPRPARRAALRRHRPARPRRGARMTAATRTRRGGARLALIAAVLAAVVVVYLTSRATPTPPYDIGSAAPDGYRALAILARGEGARVVTVPASRL